MINELQTIWKQVIFALFKALSQHLPVGTKENCEKPQTGQRVCGQRIEFRISLYEAGDLATPLLR